MTSTQPQPSILAPVPPLARALTLRLVPGARPHDALRRLRDALPMEQSVVGLGDALVRALGGEVPGLRTFPGVSGVGCVVPSTQQSLWVQLRGDGPGALFDLGGEVMSALDEAFVLEDSLDTFRYRAGNDLTGYEDGTENPKDDAAVEAAVVGGGSILAGSSFVAVQRWVHDLARFRRYSPVERDGVFGRALASNEELEDAAATAHVKRSAQESFDPPAFMLRRSMPWVGPREHGLEFIAFVESLDRYERVLRRMVGLEDGQVDALFTFSRPVTGGYYWCPPVTDDRLDLAALGL